MSDISRTIHINDDFSEPLKNLAKASFSASNSIDAFTEALAEQKEEMGEANLKWLAAKGIAFGLVKSTRELRHAVYDYTKNVLIPNTKHLANQIILKKNLIKLDIQYYSKRLVDQIAMRKALLKLDIERLKLSKSLLALDIKLASKGVWGGLLGRGKSAVTSVTSAMKKIIAPIGVFGAGLKAGFKDNFNLFMGAGVGGFKNIMSTFVSNFKTNFEFMKASGDVSLKHLINITKDAFHKTVSASGKILKDFGNKASSMAKAAGKTTAGIVGGALRSATTYVLLNLAGDVMWKAGKILASKSKLVLESVRDVISKYVDNISISDKMNAMWGDTKGNYAKQHAYRLANEFGESAQTVAELAAKAAYEGIGTSTFERAFRLSGKISALSPGVTTEDAATAIIENLKSGHDAGSIAKLLGGGQVMERQLRASGYERALRRGDMQKALSIAEKIAEQAGLTEERYQKANRGMAHDFGTIVNVIDNIKNRLGEIFARQLGSIVKRVSEFMDSDKFKNIIKYVEFGVEKIGGIVTSFVHSMLDNIGMIGTLLGGSIAIKTFMMIKNLKALSFIVGKIGGGFGLITKGVNFVGKMVGIKALEAFRWSKVVGAAIKRPLISNVKALGTAIKNAFLANPVSIILGAVTALGYGILRVTGKVASLGGALIAIGKLCQNVFHDIGVIIDTIIHGEERVEQFKETQKKIHAEIDSRAQLKSDINAQIAEIVAKAESGELPIDEASARVKELNDKFSTLTSEIDELMRQSREESDKLKNDTALKGLEGVAEAAQLSNEEAFGIIKNKFDKMLGLASDIRDTLPQNSWLRSALDKTEKFVHGIKDDSSKIRETMSQEEELRWLKAFSDRQIMSSYSSMTSNTKTVNINGMSQSSLAEMGRRNISTIPSRAAM